MIKFLRIFVLAAATVLVAPQPAPHAAEAPPPSDSPIGVGELESLVATLENDAERQQFVDHLKALIEVQRAEAETAAEGQTIGALLIEQLSLHSEALGRQVSALAGALLSLPEGLMQIRDGLADPQTRSRWLEGLLALVAVIAAGALASRFVHRLIKRPLAILADRTGASLLLRLPLLLARMVLNLVPPIAFAMAGWAAVVILGGVSVARPVALAVIYAAAFAGAINAMARTVLAPGETRARPLRMSDETALYLYIWIRRLTDLAIYGYFAVQIAGFLGLSLHAQLSLFKLIGLAMALLVVMLILQNRPVVAAAIAGEKTGKLAMLRRHLGDLWHVLAILYTVVVFLVWAVGMPGGFTFVLRATVLSVVALAAALALVTFSMRLIDRAFSLSDDIRRRLPALESRVNRYLPVVKGALRLGIWAVAILSVMQAWGLDILLWLTEDTGRALLSRLANIGAIVILAVAGWEALSAGIERYLAGQDAARSQRARTLLPLVRKVVLVALTAVVGLMLLSELGINIAPLLAGAGVIGLAIGFGAQTLVKDVITGLFILIEDSISVGDYVTLGSHSGTVEALSIRSIQLRDPAGTVFTIPFSEVLSVVNFSREFAFSVMEIGVAYKEDTDRVSQVIEEVGKALRATPEWGPKMRGDIEVLGLDRFDDSAVVIKARIKTEAGAQWAVRRAFNRLLKQRFDAEGIEIPFPQRTVWFAEPAPPAPFRPGPPKPAES